VGTQNCWITVPAGRPTFKDLCSLFATWRDYDTAAAAAAADDAVAIAVAISAAAAERQSTSGRARGYGSGGWGQSSPRFAGKLASPASKHHELHRWEHFSGDLLEDALGNTAADVPGESDAQQLLQQPSPAGCTPASPVCICGGDGGCDSCAATTAPPPASLPLVAPCQVVSEQGSPPSVSTAVWLGFTEDGSSTHHAVFVGWCPQHEALDQAIAATGQSPPEPILEAELG
jgi:hypothetical protein